jgi:hypothetical protein
MVESFKFCLQRYIVLCGMLRKVRNKLDLSCLIRTPVLQVLLLRSLHPEITEPSCYTVRTEVTKR